jgi:hypothetical protein
VSCLSPDRSSMYCFPQLPHHASHIPNRPPAYCLELVYDVRVVRPLEEF